MYTGIRLLMLIHLFVSCFFFLSNYQTLKIFVTLFSGVVRLTELKLGTHVNIVYTRIRLLVHICPFLSSFFYIFKSQTRVSRSLKKGQGGIQKKGTWCALSHSKRAHSVRACVLCVKDKRGISNIMWKSTIIFIGTGRLTVED